MATFLISSLKHILWVIVRSASLRRGYSYPQHMFLCFCEEIRFFVSGGGERWGGGGRKGGGELGINLCGAMPFIMHDLNLFLFEGIYLCVTVFLQP